MRLAHGRHPVIPVALAFLVLLATVGHAAAFTRQAARFDAQGASYVLTTDCSLNSANLCAGWIWLFDELEGAVWGSVFSPDDCPGGCVNGGAVSEVWLYARCATTPGRIGGIGISGVDAIGCRTSSLYSSGATDVVHCVPGDRWTRFSLHDPVHLSGNPFAVTVTWGPNPTGTSNPQLATDNGLANLMCHMYPEIYTFPGCATSTSDCSAWVPPAQRTFVYVTDLNGDGVLDDLCELYGQPYPVAFPYVAPYGYLPNNLVINVGLDCFSPGATEATRWGRVKALLDAR